MNIQASELIKSTQALELQVQEMKSALEQQTILTETTKQDLELSKKAFDYQIRTQHISVQPFLHISVVNKKSDHNYFYLVLNISNSRAICREVEISRKTETNGYIKSDYFDHLVSDAAVKVNMACMEIDRSRLAFNEGEPKFRVLENFKVIYLDSLDERQKLIFQLVVRINDENQDLDFDIQKPSVRNIAPLWIDI